MGQVNTMREAGEINCLENSLKAAVDLFAGELPHDCYNNWDLPLRERLYHACGETLERLELLLEEQREYASALPYVRRLLNHDPLSESAYHHLIRLHLALGDRTEAMRACRACDTMLE